MKKRSPERTYFLFGEGRVVILTLEKILLSNTTFS